MCYEKRVWQLFRMRGRNRSGGHQKAMSRLSNCTDTVII